MESRHSVQSTSVSYGGIGEIQKDVPNSRLDDAMDCLIAESFGNTFITFFMLGIGVFLGEHSTMRFPRLVRPLYA